MNSTEPRNQINTQAMTAPPTDRKNMRHISLSAPGKWILAGEHAVLRGYQAIALPRTDVHLRLDFRSTLTPSLKISPENAENALHRVLSYLKKLETQAHLIPQMHQIHQIHGTLQITGDIPSGAGLGSSAAFCLLTVRWLAHFIDIPEQDVCRMATELENEFHGQSSGIDVATIYHAEPIGVRLTPEKIPQIRKLGLTQLPTFSFHDTGVRALTRSCVEKVQALHAQHSTLAQKIDRQMDQAAAFAEESLQEFNAAAPHTRAEQTALTHLAQAMETAQNCFQQWDLAPEAAQQLILQLKSKGALAAKLTGSGGGGTIVALWPTPVSTQIQKQN